jgi:hypothetical protein
MISPLDRNFLLGWLSYMEEHHMRSVLYYLRIQARRQNVKALENFKGHGALQKKDC